MIDVMKEKYESNKIARIGQTCLCPACGSPFIKSSYQQVFCKTKPKTTCKDYFWNVSDPKRSERMAKFITNYDDNDRTDHITGDYDDTHPFSSEAF